MKEILRQAHAIAAWALVLAIVVQVFLAGAAMAQLGGSGDFATHREFGYTWVGLVALAVLITAIAARRGRRDIGLAFGLLLLYVVQTILPEFKGSISWVAALHPVNALLLFGLSIWYARRAWARRTFDANATAGAVLVPGTTSGAAADAR
jgi:uncharacterized membrane protein YhaH (DUF805 family)